MKTSNATCSICGKEFYRHPYYLRRSPTHYCSRRCYLDYRKTHPPTPRVERFQVPCLSCGKLIDRTAWDLKRYKEGSFCSNQCIADWRKVHRRGKNSPKYSLKPYLCDWCGKTILLAPCQFASAIHHFCCGHCRGAWTSKNLSGENSPIYKHGLEDYGPNWHRQRKAARARDKVCQDCGASPRELGKALDVHHLVLLADFKGNYKKGNALSNLISLCPSCHTTRHNDARRNNHPQQSP